jgi:DNA-binding NarL/FixJ family response regulator
LNRSTEEITATTPITLLLAEDHAIVRQGLVALLKADGHFAIVGEAQNGRDAVTLARRLRPDVILMDIAMPVLNGMDATWEILGANPAARILILSAHCDDTYIQAARALGVSGFVAKLASAEHLTDALRHVAGGGTSFPSARTRQRGADLAQSQVRTGSRKRHTSRLSARETEVLKLVGEGAGNRQIASVLGISFKTVEKHRQHLMDKLNIHDTAGLTRYAHAMGIIA